MFVKDHFEQHGQNMICPMLTDPLHTYTQCIREDCALWYRNSRNEDYSGCSVFIAAHAAQGVSYNTSNN